MSESKELMCLNILEELCAIHFADDEYCLGGEKESAICIQKSGISWTVFDKERNSYNDKKEFSNVVEACLEMIERLFLSDAKDAKNLFLDKITISKPA